MTQPVGPGEFFPTLPTPTPILPASVPEQVERLANSAVGFDIARPNLLRNGGFEQWSHGAGPFSQDGQETADGWFVRANADGVTPAVSRDPCDTLTGSTWGARVAGMSAGGNLLAQTIDPSVCSLNGTTVSLSFQARGPVGAQCTGIIGILGVAAFTPSRYILCTGQWQPVRLTAALPQQVPPTPVLVVLAGIGRYNFLFDNVSLVVGEIASDYQPLAPSVGTASAVDRELRIYVQRIMAILDPGGAPPPPP